MPRLGFAYQVSPKFVVRGGFGGTSFFEGDAFNQRLTSSPPFALGSTVNAPVPTNTTSGSPFSIEDGFAQQFNSTTIYSAWPQNQQPAYINEYSLTAEYALTDQLSMSSGIWANPGTISPTTAMAISTLWHRPSQSRTVGRHQRLTIRSWGRAIHC